MQIISPRWLIISYIGSNVTSLEEHDFEDHPSVHNIKQNNESNPDFNFNFRQLQVSEVQNKLKTLDKRKATGWDTISPKILNLTADGIVQSLTSLYNNCIKQRQWRKIFENWRMGSGVQKRR